MVVLQNRRGEVVNLLRSFGKVQFVGDVFRQPFEHGHRPSGWHGSPDCFRRSDNLEAHGIPAVSGHGGLMTLKRANQPLPFGVSRYYREMTVVQSTETALGLGLANFGTEPYKPFMNDPSRHESRVESRARATESTTGLMAQARAHQAGCVCCSLVFFLISHFLLEQRLFRAVLLLAPDVFLLIHRVTPDMVVEIEGREAGLGLDFVADALWQMPSFL